MKTYHFSIVLMALTHIVMGQVLQAPSHTFNTSSPVSQGPYVIGQILPCTYRLFPNVDTNGLDLGITLQALGGFATTTTTTTTPFPAPSTNGTTNTTITTSDNNNNNGTYVIIEKADVSKTNAYFKQEGNLTYFEHSINYNIPMTVKPGNYKVVFTDQSTNTNLAIPIDIRPAAPTPSLGANGASPSDLGTKHSPGSIFTGDGNAATASAAIDTSTQCLLVSFILFALSITLL